MKIQSSVTRVLKELSIENLLICVLSHTMVESDACKKYNIVQYFASTSKAHITIISHACISIILTINMIFSVAEHLKKLI